MSILLCFAHAQFNAVLEARVGVESCTMPPKTKTGKVTTKSNFVILLLVEENSNLNTFSMSLRCSKRGFEGQEGGSEGHTHYP